MSDDAFHRLFQRHGARINRGAAIEGTYVNRGTFTPIFQGTTGAGTFTYGVRAGRYTQIEDRLYFSLVLQITAITVAPTGTMRIASLPVATANIVNGYHAVTLGYVSNVKLTAGTYLTALMDPNNSYIRLVENTNNAGSADMPAANFVNANAFIIASGCYEVG